MAKKKKYDKKQMLKSGDVQELLGVHKMTLIKWRKTGKLVPEFHCTITNRFYYTLEQIKKFIEESKKKYEQVN